MRFFGPEASNRRNCYESAMASRPDEEDVRRVVGQVYDAAAERYVGVFFDDHSDDDWLGLLATHLRERSRVLDVGCGPGNFSRFFIERGHPVVGVDVSVKMLLHARALVPLGSWSQMDMRQLGFASSSFDGILLAYSALHLPTSDAIATFGELRRVVRNGASLAVMMKTGKGAEVVEASLVEGEWIYVQLWDTDDLLGSLSGAGFSVSRVEYKAPTSDLELQHQKLFVLATAV